MQNGHCTGSHSVPFFCFYAALFCELGLLSALYTHLSSAYQRRQLATHLWHQTLLQIHDITQCEHCCLHSTHTFHPLISEDSWPRMYRITDFQTLLLMHRHIMHSALRVLHAHTHRTSQPFKRFFLIVSAVSKLCVWKREEYWQSLKLWWSHEMGARILSSSCWRREELYQAPAINCCTPLQLLWAFSLPPGIHENIVGDHSKQSLWAALWNV